MVFERWLHTHIHTQSMAVSLLRPAAFPPSCRLWVGYQYVIASRNRSLEGRWEVAFKGKSFWSFRSVVGFAVGVGGIILTRKILLGALHLSPPSPQWCLVQGSWRGRGPRLWGAPRCWVGTLRPFFQAPCGAGVFSGTCASFSFGQISRLSVFPLSEGL